MHGLRDRMRSRLALRVRHEQRALHAVRARPVMRDGSSMLRAPVERLGTARSRLRRAVVLHVERQRVEAAGLEMQLRALSPQATLDRGYALVTERAGRLVRTPPSPGTFVDIRVQHGRFAAVVEGGSDE